MNSRGKFVVQYSSMHI